jgi:alkylation response protein AidB-like acyl-CoA dehydrogenase
MSGSEDENPKFGSQTPFAEPSWYDSRNESPYYNEHHVKFRNQMRSFVDKEIIPNVDEWEKAEKIPDEIFIKASQAGLIPAVMGWPEDVMGPRPEGYDGFFTLIATDELCRCASGGVVWGLIGGMGIGLPPILHSENTELKKRVGLPCLLGEKKIALCISEPTAGSDVANLKTTAVEDGDYYIVNGMKKWITCGMIADFFTVAVRTGGEGSGMMGIELLLVERGEGVVTRPMDCMGAKGSGTAFVEFYNVRVPKANIIGGVADLLRNFVTERLGIALQANRFSRMCLQLSIEYTRWRKAFGKKLIDQPVVRHRIAEMAREVETTHAFLEGLAYRLVQAEKNDGDWFDLLLRIGAEAALAKVQATKTFEHCARTAAHLQGGNAYVKGNRIESLYRHVLSLAIPGGSEDVMIDYAARLALKGRL